MSDNAPVTQKPKKVKKPKLPGMVKYTSVKEAFSGVTKEMEALHNIAVRSGANE